VQLRQLSKLIVFCLTIFCTNLHSQDEQSREYFASDLIDAKHLVPVADSFNIPHVVFFAIAWQETRRGDPNYRFPRGAGIVSLDPKCVAEYATKHFGQSWKEFEPELYIKCEHRICREIGRFQMSPCVNWSKIMNDSICTNANLLSKDKEFAYRVNLHCAAKHLAELHNGYNWVETIRRWNGQGNISYKYQASVLSYIGRFYLRRTE
jgi:hypothetical protein